MNQIITCCLCLVCWGMIPLMMVAQAPDKAVEHKIAYLDSIGSGLANQDIDSAFVLTRAALDLAVAHALPSQQAYLLSQLAVLHKKEGDYTQSHALQDSSRRLYHSLGDSVGMALPIRREADLFRIEGQYPEAQSYFLKALRLLENSDDSLGMSGVWVNLGILYTVQQQFDIAQQYYRKALAYIYRNPDTLQLINLYTNIGSTFHYQGELDSAAHYYQKVLAFENDGRYIRKMLVVYGNLAAYHFQEGRIEKGKQIIENGITKCQEHGMEKQPAFLSFLNNLGLMFSSLNENDDALRVFQKGLEISRSVKNKEVEQKLLFNISEAQSSKGDFDKAYKTIKEYVEIKDSLLNAEKLQIVNDLREKYQSELKEQQILQQEIEISEQRTKKRLSYLITLLAFVVLLLAIFIFSREKKKIIEDKKRKQEENKRKIEELVNSHQNEINNAIIENQENERSRISRELHDNVGGTLATLNLHIKSLRKKIIDSKNQGQLDIISELANSSYETVRAISHTMSYASVEHIGFLSSINKLAEIVNKTQSLRFEISGGSSAYDQLEGQYTVVLFRIIQELLTNTMKYANASKFEIELKQNNQSWMLIVRDNGVNTFSEDDLNNGTGLVNLTKTVESLKGTIEFHIKNGLTTHVTLPKLLHDEVK